MTIVNGADFKIEPRHLAEGLTTRDFTAIAGYKVVAYSYDFFPHWDQVAQDRPLTHTQTKERAQAFFNVLSLLHPDRGARGLAEKVVEIKSPFVTQRQKDLSAFPRIVQSLSDLNHKGSDNKPESFVFDEKRSVVLAHPQMLRGGHDALKIPMAALAFLPQQGTPLKSLWCDITHVPQDLLTHVPQDPLIVAMTHLHEARHLVQIDPHDNEKAAFWNELDADKFAFNTMKQNAIGKEACEAWLHFRYLNIMSLVPRYWIAPHLEAASNNKEPPTQQAVVEAARTIQQQIYIASFGSVGKSLLQRMPSFVDDRYATWKMNNIVKHPEIGFPLLRGCVEAGCFAKNSLTDAIARKILTGAEYFSPGLSQLKV